MKLPIDTSQLKFMCASAARPVVDFESKQHKADANGELLYKVQTVALDSDGAEVIQVTVPGDPKLEQGAMLRVHDLVAQAWTMNDRSGVSFRASRLEAAGVAGGAGREKAAA